MFKKKKKKEAKKEVVKTYVDGEEVPQEVPDLEVPLPEELIPEEEQTSGECFICWNRGFYRDLQGIWHDCPRCKVR